MVLTPPVSARTLDLINLPDIPESIHGVNIAQDWNRIQEPVQNQRVDLETFSDDDSILDTETIDDNDEFVSIITRYYCRTDAFRIKTWDRQQKSFI